MIQKQKNQKEKTASIPENLAELTVGNGRWSLTLACAPFRPPWGAPDYGSPLFPTKDTGKPVTDAFFGNVLELKTVAWDEDYAHPGFVFDPAFGVAAGTSRGFLEVSLYGFYGRDRAPATAYRMVIPDSESCYFYARKESAKILSSGISLAYRADTFSAYTETSWSGGRLISVGSVYDSSGQWQETRRVSRLSATAGFELKPALRLPGRTRCTCGAELRDAFYAADPGTLAYPFLHRAFSAYAEANAERLPLQARVDAIWSLSDGSAALKPSLTFGGGESARLSLAAAIPFGGDFTELGQFGKQGQVFICVLASY